MDVVVLRTESPHALWAKRPGSPVLLRLVFVEALTDTQLAHLLMAGPFRPVWARVHLGHWSFTRKGFVAELFELTVPARPPRPPTRTRRGFMGTCKSIDR